MKKKKWKIGGDSLCRVCYQRGLPRLVLMLLHIIAENWAVRREGP